MSWACQWPGCSHENEDDVKDCDRCGGPKQEGW